MPTFRDDVVDPLAVLRDRRPVAELTCGELQELVAAHVRLAIGKPLHDELLTPEQVAKAFKITRRTLDRLAADGVIPPGQLVGGSRRWTRSQILDFCRELAAAAEAERRSKA